MAYSPPSTFFRAAARAERSFRPTWRLRSTWPPHGYRRGSTLGLPKSPTLWTRNLSTPLVETLRKQRSMFPTSEQLVEPFPSLSDEAIIRNWAEENE
jgi:hypothetical protein